LLVSVALTLLALWASPVLAGGVIIDGHGNPADAAGYPDIDLPDADGSDPDGSQAQQIYLWAAYLFYATPPENEEEIDLERPETPISGSPLRVSTRIIDELDAEAAGGCAALPTPLLAALLGLLALARRRR
jgi:hypothetical protein